MTTSGRIPPQRGAVILISLAVAAGACTAYADDSPSRSGAETAVSVSRVVDGAEARSLVAAGARLIDVRTPEEFASGHIDGAVNIPIDELPARIGELEPSEDPVVIYCRSGRRSAIAATALVDAGFEAVYDLGPMSAW